MKMFLIVSLLVAAASACTVQVIDDELTDNLAALQARVDEMEKGLAWQALHAAAAAACRGTFVNYSTPSARILSDLEFYKRILPSTPQILYYEYIDHVTRSSPAGSVPSGGTGPWGNAVLAKENTKSCDDICGASIFAKCDADISIQG